MSRPGLHGIARRGVLLALGLLGPGLLAGAGRAGVVTDLAPGAVHHVTPGDAECVTNSFLEPDEVDQIPLFCPIRGNASCGPNGSASLNVVSCVTLRAVRGGSHAHYQFWFRVMPEASDASDTPTFVPVHIFAPGVTWNLSLGNGSVADAGAASATFFLRLRADPVDDLGSRGTPVAQTPVLLASHGGINGCLSIPTGVDDVVNLLISCERARSQRQEGKASPSIAAVVEVGRVYNVELAMDFLVDKRATAKPTSLDVQGGPAMSWSELVVSIGSDAGDLRSQIEDLRTRLANLREDFDFHSHPYLTGRGRGHNNAEASTGLPSLPDGGAPPGGGGGTAPGGAGADVDGDGLSDSIDACPGSPWGEPVDAAGCTAQEFCAQRSRWSECTWADWQGDGDHGSRDCQWRRRTCQAR